MKKDSFIKKVGIYFIGNISTKLLSLILIPIYAFFTTAGELGNFDYIITLSSAIYPILFISIWESCLKFLIKEEDQNTIIRNTSNLVFFSIVMMVLGFFLTLLFNLFVENSYLIYFFTILYGLTSIWQYYARSVKQNKLFVTSSLISSLVNILSIMIFLVLLKMGLNGLLFSFIFSQIAMFLILEFKLKILSKVRFSHLSWEILYKFLSYSLPLMINHLFLWALSSFGRVYINNNFGDTENGLISFATKISIPVSMLGSVIIMSLIEEAIIESDNYVRIVMLIKRITKVMSYLALIVLPAAAIGYFIIKDTQYIDSLGYFPYLLLYALISVFSSIAGSLFQSYGITKFQYITTAIGGIINIALIYILAPNYNVYGVLLAQVMGMFIVLISRIIFIKKSVGINFPFVSQMIFIIIFSLLSYAVVSSHVYINIILFILISFISIILNIGEIKLLTMRFKKQ